MLTFFEQSIYGRMFNPQDIPADPLTHVNFAFADVHADGEVYVSATPL